MKTILLIAAMTAGVCAGCGDPDPTDPYGTWRFSYPASPCADGKRVDTIRIVSDDDVRWPAPDGETDVTTLIINGPNIDLIVSSVDEGRLLAFIYADDNPHGTAQWSGDDGAGGTCMIARTDADVTKLEDE